MRKDTYVFSLDPDTLLSERTIKVFFHPSSPPGIEL